MDDKLKSLSFGDEEPKITQSSGFKENLIDTYFTLFSEMYSTVKDEIYLKGNVLLNKLLPTSARATVDLDLSCYSADLYYSSLVPILTKFGERIVCSGLATSFEIKSIEPRMSGGIKFYNGDAGVSLGVDVSLSNKCAGTTAVYTFADKSIIGSSINKIIADKCLATLSRKRFRRVKDFYDLFIILESGFDYNPSTIYSLMLQSVGADEVNLLFTHIPFSEDVITQLHHAWTRLVLRNVLTDDKIKKPRLSDVLISVSDLYDILYSVHTREG